MRYAWVGLAILSGCALPRAPERPATVYGYCGFEVENIKRQFPGLKPSQETHEDGGRHYLFWSITDPDRVIRNYHFHLRELPGARCGVDRSVSTIR
jgi:hypothetical protein